VFEKNWQEKMKKIIEQIIWKKRKYKTSPLFFLINRINSSTEIKTRNNYAQF
jgi:hypothetical protein